MIRKTNVESDTTKKSSPHQFSRKNAVSFNLSGRPIRNDRSIDPFHHCTGATTPSPPPRLSTHLPQNTHSMILRLPRQASPGHQWVTYLISFPDVCRLQPVNQNHLVFIDERALVGLQLFKQGSLLPLRRSPKSQLVALILGQADQQR